jgi:hypothetical protein
MKIQFVLIVVVLTLAGCAGQPTRTSAPDTKSAISKPSGSAKGGYYKDDGPEANPPANLDAIRMPCPSRKC